MPRHLLYLTCCLLIFSGCARIKPSPDADVIIVGAGIAGLSAALEARAHGATVLILEANSVGGGHAVKAGGFALVDTQLQRSKGIQDSADLAWGDFVHWGADPDPYWTRRYAEESGSEVYDWLTERGVDFRMVLDTPEDSVPRFHFTRGTAVNAVVPLMREAFMDPGIQFIWNARVSELTRSKGAIDGVTVVHERTGEETRYKAAAILLATGGFQNNLDMVRKYWAGPNPPQNLLKGAGHFATGDGYRLAQSAGAHLQRMTKQVTFYTGVPNPRDSAGKTAYFAQNPAAIWLDNYGRRFINESANSKTIETNLRELQLDGFWMVFDAQGAKRFSLRGSPWLNAETIRQEFLNNPAITQSADTLTELAEKMGLPAANLIAALQVWNRMLQLGTDYQFDRFNADAKPRGLKPVQNPPYYAVRLHPMTRKSMGGPAISSLGQVIDENRIPIRGLYAAGELTGVAGINGSHGGSGTFLGPSVLTGRIAGRQAAISSSRSTRLKWRRSAEPTGEIPDYGLPGYWHYDAVHRTALELRYNCAQCHSEQQPIGPATAPAQRMKQLSTCSNCH